MNGLPGPIGPPGPRGRNGEMGPAVSCVPIFQNPLFNTSIKFVILKAVLFQNRVLLELLDSPDLLDLPEVDST